MKYPHSTFDCHDPHHVTLQLLQEIHSQRIQVQIDRDKERAERHQAVGQVASYREDLRVRDEAHKQTATCLFHARKALMEISKSKTKAGRAARSTLDLLHKLEGADQ